MSVSASYELCGGRPGRGVRTRTRATRTRSWGRGRDQGQDKAPRSRKCEYSIYAAPAPAAGGNAPEPEECPVGRRNGGVWEGTCVCVCVGVRVSRSIRRACVVRRRAARWKPRETDGSVQQLLGPRWGWWKARESDLEVRLAISPGVVPDSAAGVGCKRQVWSYRVVTVPTVCHAAHLPLWADRAVLLGHFQSCPATNSRPSVLHACVCSSSLFFSWIPVWPVLDVVDTPRSSRWHSVPGQPLEHRPRHRYCAVGDLHWV